MSDYLIHHGIKGQMWELADAVPDPADVMDIESYKSFHHGEKLTMYPDQHNYLIHWLKKGQKAKYIDKVKLANGRWRYFYTQAELEAYKAQKKLSKGAGELADKAKNGLRGLKEGALDVGARAVVGVARNNSAIAGRLGAHEKGHANHDQRLANERLANARRLQSSSEREAAKSASAYRRGWDDRSDDAMRKSEKLRSQAQEESSWASYWQGRAAESQKKYDQTVLGRAEARVRRADVRKATEATRNKILDAAKQHQESKPATQTPKGQKVGSLFADNRPHSRKKTVTEGGAGVHKRDKVGLGGIIKNGFEKTVKNPPLYKVRELEQYSREAARKKRKQERNEKLIGNAVSAAKTAAYDVKEDIGTLPARATVAASKLSSKAREHFGGGHRERAQEARAAGDGNAANQEMARHRQSALGKAEERIAVSKKRKAAAKKRNQYVDKKTKIHRSNLARSVQGKKQEGMLKDAKKDLERQKRARRKGKIPEVWVRKDAEITPVGYADSWFWRSR